MKRTWPEDWESRKLGIGCHFCQDLRGQSFRSGRISEAILEKQHAIAVGHVAVVFNGRHAATFTDLGPDEVTSYWSDIQEVGRAVEQVFEPCHVNYLLLGNIVPHLHVHVIPRYLDDPAPERPLPWNTSAVHEELFASQFRRLKDAAAAAARTRE
jgi:diadenosine tetraphosphate (Ap4A) HIT family hydrolase